MTKDKFPALFFGFIRSFRFIIIATTISIPVFIVVSEDHSREEFQKTGYESYEDYGINMHHSEHRANNRCLRAIERIINARRE